MQVAQMMQMMQMLKHARNPQAMFNQMVASNPQIKQVVDYVNQNGGDAQAAFYKLADEKGINPDDILSKLR